MPTTVSVLIKSLSGEAGPFSLFLRTSAGLLLNTGGDALTEIENPPGTKTGIWSATVAETLAVDYSAAIYEGTTETTDNIVWDGGLKLGETELRPDWPIPRPAVLDSTVQAQLNLIQSAVDAMTGGLTEEEAEQLAKIHEALFPEDPDVSPIVILPSDGDFTTVWFRCINQAGQSAAGVTIYYRTINPPAKQRGFGYVPQTLSVVSAVNGVVQIPEIPLGCALGIWAVSLNNKQRVFDIPFVVDDDGNYALPAMMVE